MRRALPAALILLVAAWLPAAVGAPADPLVDLKGNFCRAGGGLLPGRAPQARDYDWDILHAELRLAPNFTAATLAGSVRFDSRAETAGLAAVTLDFTDAMSLLAVRQDGSPVAFTHGGGLVGVTLAAPLPAGALFSLELDFAGAPASSGFGSFTWTEHSGTPLVATLSEPEGARDWWPCKDVPDEKFTADIHYRVPVAYSAPGPGLLQSVTDHGDGTHTWHWLETYPINSYLIALTVTNYQHYTDWYVSASGDSLPIENYVYPENYSNSVEDLSITPLAIAILDSLFGEYPFIDEKYGHMVFHWAGAMEHQTCTSMGNLVLGGGHYYDRIVMHELAHQWFGNAVTLQDWENVWLNEGFASYAEAIWFEYTGGQAGLTNWMTLTTSDFVGPVYNNPVLFGNVVYRKGAWVLHMLRWLLGDETFFGALRYYYGQHLYGNAHTTDLEADLEAYTGRDLTGFFAQWVYGENDPSYQWAWQARSGEGGWWLDLQVRQVQSDAGLFTLPLPLRVTTPLGSVDLRVDNEAWFQQYSLPLGAQQPLDLAFDPDNWVLESNSEVPFDPTATGEAPVLATALRGCYPNPFNPTTRVAFTLAAAGPVRLEVFDAAGRRLRVLADGPRPAGPQSLAFDGLDARGEPLPSGVYLLRLSAGDRAYSQRAVLLK
jgi:aminopeptidase N